MKRLKPFEHLTSGKWAIQLPAKLSPTGKRKQVYFGTKKDADEEVKRLQGEVDDFGSNHAISTLDRRMLGYAKEALGDIRLLPEVIQHWKATGPGSITPITVNDAVEQFKAWQLPRVSKRTQSDIRWRLATFAGDFKDRFLHNITSAEVQKWIYSAKSSNIKKRRSKNPGISDWSAYSFFKRIRPLFDYAMLNRWIAKNPLEFIKAPETPSEPGEIFTGKQFQTLLDTADKQKSYLFPYLALAGFAWFRNKEIVRQYENEDTLRWENIDFTNKRIIVPKGVGKKTKRKGGNSRVVPMSDNLFDMLESCRNKTGRIIDKLECDFAADMKKLHTDAKVTQIHNGLRRSAISHYLAYHPETGVGQLASWAGTSEATVKRHYREVLLPEEGKQWFKQWEFTVEGEGEDLTITATKI